MEIGKISVIGLKLMFLSGNIDIEYVIGLMKSNLMNEYRVRATTVIQRTYHILGFFMQMLKWYYYYFFFFFLMKLM